MRSGIFITGTDTDVGKTMVTAGVVSALTGDNALPMKPVQTGCVKNGDGFSVPDLDFICETVGLQPTDEELKLMCPYAFEPACSPHLAAKEAGQDISFERIIECYEALSANHTVIVEGAGGVLVPIIGEKLMLDLMVKLGLPVLLVARAGLGTINHTMLSVRELRRAGLDIMGIIFNQLDSDAPQFIEDDNIDIIAELCDVPVLGRLPFMEDPKKELLEVWKKEISVI